MILNGFQSSSHHSHIPGNIQLERRVPTLVLRRILTQILCVPPSRQCWRLSCLSALVFQFATSCFLVDFLWLCQFYSHTATTVEAEDASSSHSQDSGQVHKVISRVRGKHVSWPQGYQGVRGGARLE